MQHKVSGAVVTRSVVLASFGTCSTVTVITRSWPLSPLSGLLLLMLL